MGHPCFIIARNFPGYEVVHKCWTCFIIFFCALFCRAVVRGSEGICLSFLFLGYACLMLISARKGKLSEIVLVLVVVFVTVGADVGCCCSSLAFWKLE